MANEETTPEVTLETIPEQAPETTSEADQEQTYSLTELRENAPLLFGVQAEVIAGAIYGNARQEFTVAEMKKLINTFLKKKVK